MVSAKQPKVFDTSHLGLTPIGIIRTSMKLKFDAPPQPDGLNPEASVIELFEGHKFEDALQDLDGFSHIWLLWWFHRNPNWRAKVLPPRGSKQRRGVFATRSPYRPNPLGLTAVPLLKIDGRKIYVGANDLVDETPILDIKPYLSTYDSIPNASLGWVAEVQAELEAAPRFSISYSPLAEKQITWLKENCQIDFIERASTILTKDPTPHRTRRIARYKEGQFRMACGAWRLIFSVKGQAVIIERIFPGYPIRFLTKPEYVNVPHRQAQIAFGEVWGGLG